MMVGAAVLVLCWGKGCLFLEKILGWWKEKEKSGEGQGEGNLDSGERVVGLCCSRTSTETKVVITTDY